VGICYNMVQRTAPVWSCGSCYSIFHLPYIRKWARSPASAPWRLLPCMPDHHVHLCPRALLHLLLRAAAAVAAYFHLAVPCRSLATSS
jgi:hypothetical protein